jgi:CheY-specific phosphatase CheX
MIVDANRDYRAFFAAEAARYGPVREADSGATALVMFKEFPSRLVFIGQGLGVVGPDALARKLRALTTDVIRVVAIVESQQRVDVGNGLFDDCLVRSFVPRLMQEQLRPFTNVPGPAADLAERVPGLRDVMDSAVRQVFGMMFDGEVVPCQTPPERVDVQADLSVAIDGQFTLAVRVLLSESVSRAATARMFGCTTDDASDEDRQSTAGEIGNQLVGRLHSHLREAGIASECSLPVTAPGGPIERPQEAEGFLMGFSVPGAGDLFLTVRVALSR